MRADRAPRSRSSRMLLGVLAICLGSLFLLDNLGIFDVRKALPFWLLVFIVVGVVKLCDGGSRNGVLVGGVLSGVGVVTLLNRLGFFYISWRSLWPLALIGLRVTVLLRPSTRNAAKVSLSKGKQEEDIEFLDVTAILRGFQPCHHGQAAWWRGYGNHGWLRTRHASGPDRGRSGDPYFRGHG